MSALIVTAAVAVLPTVDGREQYLYQGSIVDSDGFTEKGLEHARAQALIDDAPEIVEDEDLHEVFTADDVAAAVKAATEAKDAELAEARKALQAARVEGSKTETVKAAATKTTAAKQS